MPWKIHRAQLPLPGHRVVDLYTKSGSVGAYASQFILIPDFCVSVAVLTAGPESGMANYISDVLVTNLLPVLQRCADAYTLEVYGGLYEDCSSNSSLRIGANDGPSLVVERWINNGSDILQTAADYAALTNGGELQSVRLFPTGLSSHEQDVFRAFVPTTGQGEGIGFYSSNDSSAWSSVDQLVYGHRSADRVVFGKETGKVLNVYDDALRRTLIKGGA